MSFVVLPLSALAFVWPERLLQLVLLFSAFGASAALIFGSLGLQPALVPALLFIGYVILQYLLGVRYSGDKPVFRTLVPLLLFTTYAVISARILPQLFAGQIDVWPQKNEIFASRVPLAPNQGNITQSLYMALNTLLLTATALFSTRRDFKMMRIMNTYFVVSFVALGICAWQFANKHFGIWYPADFLYSNPGYAILTTQEIHGVPRLNGSFVEPASLASFLSGAVFSTAWVVIHGHRSRLAIYLLPAAVLGILFSTSTTGITAVLIGGAILTLYGLTSAAGSVRARMLRMGVPVLLLLFVGISGLPVILPGFLTTAFETILEVTVNKNQTSSYEDRTSTDLDSLSLVASTYGLGAGWGSNRSSSLIPGLAGNVGVIGCVLAAWFSATVFGIVRRAKGRLNGDSRLMVLRALSGAVAGSLIASLISGPTIVEPSFFVLLGLLIGCAARIAMATSYRRRQLPASYLERPSAVRKVHWP